MIISEPMGKMTDISLKCATAISQGLSFLYNAQEWTNLIVIYLQIYIYVRKFIYDMKIQPNFSILSGYMLYNERMLETYLHAKKWLRPSGRMFPSRGDLHVAPFNDEALYYEQLNKANFW